MVSGWAGHLVISAGRSSIPLSAVCGDTVKSRLNILIILTRHFHYRFVYVGLGNFRVDFLKLAISPKLVISPKSALFPEIRRVIANPFSNLPVVRYVTIWRLHPVRSRVGSLKNWTSLPHSNDIYIRMGCVNSRDIRKRRNDVNSRMTPIQTLIKTKRKT